MLGTGPLARCLAVGSLAWIVGAALAAGEERLAAGPRAVSPGSTEVASRASRCAAFSWASVDGAAGYELAVYRLDAAGDVEPEPFLSRRIDGRALSWTPELESCPARGERHAWTVRAVTAEGATAWSEPLFFAVESGPSEDELSWALEILRRHTEGGAGATAEGARASPSGAEAAVEPRSARPIETREGGAVRASSALFAGQPWARLKVAGEVRTIDPGDATRSRLWGTGRVAANQVYGKKLFGFEVACVHEGVRFGLSEVLVDWGSAPAACPAGTWVCRGAEVGLGEYVGCDTERPDTNVDFISCDGGELNREENGHVGWLAEGGIYNGLPVNGLMMTEYGTTNVADTCASAPVWCCWE
jgi:hypothetical protein